MRKSIFTNRGGRQRSLSRSSLEERLQKQVRLIDLAPVAAIVRELGGTVKFWSQGAEALYGWTQEEALGQRTRDLFQTEYPEPLKEIIATLVQGRRWKGESRHRTKDGHMIVVETQWLAEFDGNGKVVELLETNTDITWKKELQEHLEEKVRQRTAELQKSNETIESFSYSVSHDLWAPLRAIANYAQLARGYCRGEMHKLAEDYLDKIIGLACRTDRFVENVMAVSRISKQPLEIKPVALGKVVRDIIHERPELQEPLADVRVEGDLAVVEGEERLLAQVVANLLGNAVKFVARGTKPRVRVRTEPFGERTRLWIEDNGVGISRRGQERIFNLFGCRQAVENYESAGIGLTIVRKAVERMGGAVGVLSELVQGSRFWVDLPQCGDTSRDPVEAQSQVAAVS